MLTYGVNGVRSLQESDNHHGNCQAACLEGSRENVYGESATTLELTSVTLGAAAMDIPFNAATTMIIKIKQSNHTLIDCKQHRLIHININKA